MSLKIRNAGFMVLLSPLLYPGAEKLIYIGYTFITGYHSCVFLTPLLTLCFLNGPAPRDRSQRYDRAPEEPYRSQRARI